MNTRFSIAHVLWFAAGAAVGLTAVSAYRSQSFAPTALVRMLDTHEIGTPLAALSCVPNAQEDDVFFVTCGGIY